MTWEEFLEYLEMYRDELDAPDGLMMSGARGDNGTAYLDTQKGVLVDCTFNSLLANSRLANRDFVWFGSEQARVMGDLQTGGHPSLAGFQQVCCAGVIKKRHFFFHSGHYHPKAEHAIVFLLVFVRKSCEGLGGTQRDALVDELCNMRHVLYCHGSETETYSASLAMLLGHEPKEEPVSRSSSSSFSMPISHAPSKPMSIGKSQPLSIGGPKPASSRPIVITSPRPVPTTSTTSTTSTTAPMTTAMTSTIASTSLETSLDEGISRPGQHMRRKSSEGGRPLWIPDSAVSKCQACSKEFTTFRRKHHCRQCGDIFCDPCTKYRKQVRLPARNGDKEEKGELRVCYECSRRLDL